MSTRTLMEHLDELTDMYQERISDLESQIQYRDDFGKRYDAKVMELETIARAAVGELERHGTLEFLLLKVPGARKWLPVKNDVR